MVGWEVSDAGADPFPPRYGRWHAGKRKGAAAREAPSVARTRPPGIRERPAWADGAVWGPFVAGKAGNASGTKGPWSGKSAGRRKGALSCSAGQP